MKYDVTLTRDLTESVMMTVIAKNPDDAEDTALANVPAHGWEIDDGSVSETVYVSGVDEA